MSGSPSDKHGAQEPEPSEAEKKAAAELKLKQETAAVGHGIDATLERAKNLAADKRRAIWKPSTQVFLGLDEDEVAAALGLPNDRVKFTYTPKSRDGVAGVELTGARK